MTIREGAWDCPVCDRTRNRGPEKHCAGCGHPRGRDVEFYLPADAAEVTDPEGLAKARSGADWSCAHCGGDNRADSDFCTGCGAPGEGAARRHVVVHRDSSADPATAPPRALSSPPPVTAPPQPLHPPEPPSSPPRLSKARRKELKKASRKKVGRSRRTVGIGCLALIGAIALLLWYLTRTTETTATVSGFAWERTIEIEKLVTVTEEAAQGQVPAGARILDSTPLDAGQTRVVTERIQVGSERVKVGVRDLGNGYFEDVYEDRPVYETRQREVPVRGSPDHTVRYEIDRWRGARQERAGGSDRSPRWPVVVPGPGEREGARSQSYTVLLFGDSGEALTFRARNEAEWRSFEPGARYWVEATRGGRIARLRGM